MTELDDKYAWIREEHGICAISSPDDLRICAMQPGHDGPHGWEPDAPSGTLVLQERNVVLRVLVDLLEAIGEPWDEDQDCRFCGGHYNVHADCPWRRARETVDSF